MSQAAPSQQGGGSEAGQLYEEAKKLSDEYNELLSEGKYLDALRLLASEEFRRLVEGGYLSLYTSDEEGNQVEEDYRTAVTDLAKVAIVTAGDQGTVYEALDLVEKALGEVPGEVLELADLVAAILALASGEAPRKVIGEKTRLAAEAERDEKVRELLQKAMTEGKVPAKLLASMSDEELGLLERLEEAGLVSLNPPARVLRELAGKSRDAFTVAAQLAGTDDPDMVKNLLRELAEKLRGVDDDLAAKAEEAASLVDATRDELLEKAKELPDWLAAKVVAAWINAHPGDVDDEVLRLAEELGVSVSPVEGAAGLVESVITTLGEGVAEAAKKAVQLLLQGRVDEAVAELEKNNIDPSKLYVSIRETENGVEVVVTSEPEGADMTLAELVDAMRVVGPAASEVSKASQVLSRYTGLEKLEDYLSVDPSEVDRAARLLGDAVERLSGDDRAARLFQLLYGVSLEDLEKAYAGALEMEAMALVARARDLMNPGRGAPSEARLSQARSLLEEARRLLQEAARYDPKAAPLMLALVELSLSDLERLAELLGLLPRARAGPPESEKAGVAAV